MKNSPVLYKNLRNYAKTDFYPFHMPGHKRRMQWAGASSFPNPYEIDITEIEGFDNLHHPEGIIRESMDWAASLYGAHKTYYLINGSSSGILSAVSGTVPDSGTILISRNCHKSVYHGIYLKSLKSEYIYPQYSEEYGIQCGLDPEEIELMLKKNRDISAVLMVSPTYDGIVSDVKAVSEICHKNHIPLIVDEAHGAHFRYGDIFPVPALESGADVVIQSVHKTLPCFTQSALLHLREGYIDTEKIERYLQIYQSSSPSYVLMAGIERGLLWMEQEEGREKMKEFSASLRKLRQDLKNMRNLKIPGREIVGTQNIFDLDISKIIISVKGTDITGPRLAERLRNEYHLEMEMWTEDYVTAITTVMDTKEGLNRLREGLLTIDRELKPSEIPESVYPRSWKSRPAVTIHEAWNRSSEQVPLRQSRGRISAEFLYLYPPGIPLIAPGELITEEIIETVMRYKEERLPVQGLKDRTTETISVLSP